MKTPPVLVGVELVSALWQKIANIWGFLITQQFHSWVFIYRKPHKVTKRHGPNVTLLINAQVKFNQVPATAERMTIGDNTVLYI